MPHGGHPLSLRRPRPGWRPPPRTPVRGGLVRVGQRVEKAVVVMLGSVVAGGVWWLFWVGGQGQPRHPLRLKTPQRLLVLAPHPDDEMVLAGGLLMQNTALGGASRVVYLTDGDGFFEGSLARLYRARRRREARSAMKYLGVPRQNLRFVGASDRFLSLTPRDTARMARLLKDETSAFNPTMVVTPAYEGGHCWHDLTNVLAASAVKAAPGATLWEATEYHPFFGLQTPQKTLAPLVNPVLGLLPGKPRLKPGPVFIPPSASPQRRKTPVHQVALTYAERRKKSGTLKKYASQNLQQRLLRRFAGGEVLRPYPGYDYSRPPFTHRQSLNYKLCDRWLGGTQVGRWLLWQYGTPALASLPQRLSQGPLSKPERRCQEYSVCHITHQEFWDRLPDGEKH